MQMQNQIMKDVKKLLEFYQALGFESLPIKLAINKTTNPPFSALGRIRRGESKEGRAGIKEAGLKSLREEIGDCKRCRLSNGRTNIVFGEGNPDTRLMFIGEAPGREEDLQARPFVGDAG